MISPNDPLMRDISLITELENQSDRGATIVAAAWVEESILQAIRVSLQAEQKSWNRLFGRSGSLDTLSAKIDIACLLGIISDEIRMDLHTIRDVRNEFAHSVLTKTDDMLTFESPHIKDKCFSLRCIAIEKPSRARIAFLRSCAILNSDFYFYSIIAEPITNMHQIHLKT